MKTIILFTLMAVILALGVSACNPQTTPTSTPTSAPIEISAIATLSSAPATESAPAPTAEPLTSTAAPTTPAQKKAEPLIFTNKEAVRALAFSPDSKQLAAGYATQEGTVLVWDLASGLESGQQTSRKLTATMKDNTTWITSLTFSPDGVYLAAGSASGDTFVWDLSKPTGDPYKVITPVQASEDCSQTKNCNSLALFSPTENLLAIAYESFTPTGRIVLWDLGEEDLRLTIPGKYTNALAFSPDGTALAAGGSSGAIYAWKVADGTQILEVSAPGAGITGIAYTPGGTMLVTGTVNGVVQSWHSDDGKQSGQMLTMLNDMFGFGLSPDGKTVVVGAEKGQIALLGRDESGISRLRLFPYPSSQALVYQVTFSPDRKLFAAGGSDGSVVVWEAEVLP